jgi:hypothetical protein
MFSFSIKEFLVSVAANIAAANISGSELIGYLLGYAALMAWVISWHRKRIAVGKRGMDSWYFVALSSMVAVSAIAAAAYGIGLRSTAAASSPNSTTTPVAPIQSEKPKPGKFYSQRNKNDLADALTDLSGILNTTGDDIVKKTDTLMKMWDHQMVLASQQNNPDTVSLVGQFKALSDSTVVLNRAIYDDDGFLQKHAKFQSNLHFTNKHQRFRKWHYNY